MHADALPGRMPQGPKGTKVISRELVNPCRVQSWSTQVHQQPHGSLPCSHPVPGPTSGHSSCRPTSCLSWALTTQMVISASPPTLGWAETFPCLPSPSQKVPQAPKLPFFRTVLRQGLPLAHTLRECSSTGVYLIFFFLQLCVCVCVC